MAVTFHPDLVGQSIEIAALRDLLDRAEAEILRLRKDWQAVDWPKEG